MMVGRLRETRVKNANLASVDTGIQKREIRIKCKYYLGVITVQMTFGAT